MNLDHDFFQVSKLSEDQKKGSLPKIEELFPQIQVKNKKKEKRKRSSPKIEEFFSPSSSDDQKTSPNIIQRSDADHSQLMRGLQM